MNKRYFTLKIGGQAGQGIKSSGMIIARTANRSGYHVYTHTEYPSVIRGGHNVMQINISEEEVTAPSLSTQLLVALNQETIDLHLSELSPGAGIIYDEDDKFDISKVDPNTDLFLVPLSRLAKESGGKDLLSNTVSLGAVVAILDGNINTLKELLSEEFGAKGPEMVDLNQKAAEAGYQYIRQHYEGKVRNVITPVNTMSSVMPRMLINGNEAVALGAIAGGLQFAAIYPMSPISNILHVLALHQEKYGYVYKQPEDEISAINMIIGASFAGARSMTATSGGGFCLMTEAYGLSGIAEIPVVVVDGMRGGPATGLPTWSEQGDLRFVLHAHQGDFPRIVLAAGDPCEAFYLMRDALNLAERYQCPVVLLIDKNICENDQTFPFFDLGAYTIDRGKIVLEKKENYQRYVPDNDGVSSRSIPGLGNFFISNSDEHDYCGYSSEDISIRNEQSAKRMVKLEACAFNDMPKPQLFGPEEAELTIVSWGSNKGSILEAMKNYPTVNYLHLTWVNPFPAEETAKILGRAKRILNIECNYTAQMAGLIREKTGILITDHLLKYDGRPFYPEEIEEKIQEIMEGGNR